jgi:hypothetical protein
MTCPEALKARSVPPTPSPWRSCSQGEIQGGSPVRDAGSRRAEAARTSERHRGRSCRSPVGRRHQQAIPRCWRQLRGIWLGREGRNRARLDYDASVRRLFIVHAGRGGPVRVVNVRFVAHCGLKSDIALGPKSAKTQTLRRLIRSFRRRSKAA